MDKFRVWKHLSWKERWACFEAVGWLGIARFSLLIFPFRWVLRLFGIRQDVAQTEVDGPLADVGQDAVIVKRALRRVSRNVPWDCKCLAQALAGKAMLSRRGLPATLFIGVTRDDQREFRAHAWLKSGAAFISGGEGHEAYTVMSGFSAVKKAGVFKPPI